ncbi:MAG: serine/threonine-protein kinase [Myxococcales bacterium]|nr:serine/threonine-protein kinase [Myxococcales bacterium]
MSSTTRLILGLVVVVGCLGAGAVMSAQHRQQLVDAANRTADEQLEAAWTRAAGGLRALSGPMGERAASVAGLDNIAKLLQDTTSQSDLDEVGRTFDDARRSNEPWLTGPVAESTLALFIGSRPVSTSEPALTAESLRLISEAEGTGKANALVVVGGPWLLGVARTKVQNRSGASGFIALGQRVGPDDLRALSAGGALQLVTGGDVKSAIGAGDADGLARLSRRRISMKRDESHCCLNRELVEGLELALFKDPLPLLQAAEAEATRGQWPRLGIAAALALLGVIALLLAGRRTTKADEERDQLLRETQAQLRQSHEVLQKLSTGAFATQAVAGGLLPAPTQDALASTQASATASRYEVVAPLGQGGMAKVFIAVVRGAEGFKRTFVLKRLKAEHAGNQELVNQFIDEARLGASLVQSNIVPIFDFGRDAEGYYLAQEYILGRDVDALIEASKNKRGTALEVPIVAAIAQEALKALAYAHTRTTDAGQAAGLVHRDVSPANLMVSGRGEVKLLDFGIVLSADRVTQTQAGVVKGNLFFMSPEQARALPVDPRSDLFSLAMVMVNAALGRPLYTGETMYELMTRAAAGPTEADLALVRGGTGPLSTFLLKALAVDPALRFQSAKEMATALASAVPSAPASELEALMSTLFKEDLEADRQRFAEAS